MVRVKHISKGRKPDKWHLYSEEQQKKFDQPGAKLNKVELSSISHSITATISCLYHGGENWQYRQWSDIREFMYVEPVPDPATRFHMRANRGRLISPKKHAIFKIPDDDFEKRTLLFSYANIKKAWIDEFTQEWVRSPPFGQGLVICKSEDHAEELFMLLKISS